MIRNDIKVKNQRGLKGAVLEFGNQLNEGEGCWLVFVLPQPSSVPA